MQLVSVIMPVFEAVNWIKTSIKSILLQNYKNFELIIIDGGSQDGTIDIIDKIKDDRIRLFKLDEKSFIKKLNYGIMQAKGDWVIRMDADDISHSDRIYEQMNFIANHPGTAFVGVLNGYILNGTLLVRRKRDWRFKELTYQDLTENKMPCADGACLFNRSMAIKVGLYDVEYEKETSLWYKLLDCGKGYAINNPLMFYRLHQDQMSLKQIDNDYDWFNLRKKYDPEGFKKLDIHQPKRKEILRNKINRNEQILELTMAGKDRLNFIKSFIAILYLTRLNYNSIRRIILKLIRRETLKFWNWDNNKLPLEYKVFIPETNDRQGL